MLPSESIIKARFGDAFLHQFKMKMDMLIAEAKRNLHEAKQNFERSKINAMSGNVTGVVLAGGKCPYSFETFKSKSLLDNHIRLEHPGQRLD